MCNQKNSMLKEIISWILCLAIAAVSAYILNAYVFRLTIVKGDSMNSTLIDGQTLYVDKLNVRFNEPKRGDILNVKYPNSNDGFLKRVVGLPGEVISIKDNIFYINGEIGEDRWNGEHQVNDMDPVTVPEDNYFVMGDNRSNSKDSRTRSVGPIPKNQIIGRIVFRIYPFSEFGSIEYKY